MKSFGLALPVLPGKEVIIREVAEEVRARRSSEYRQSRQRAGIALERAYLQRNPDGGTMVIAYIEADGGLADVMRSFITSGLDFDRYFVDRNTEATGIDFAAGPQGPDPEMVGEWVAAGANPRQRGLAFAVPLRPGQTDAGRRFAEEAYTSRKQEMTESRTAKGLARESVFLVGRYPGAGITRSAGDCTQEAHR